MRHIGNQINFHPFALDLFLHAFLEAMAYPRKLLGYVIQRGKGVKGGLIVQGLPGIPPRSDPPIFRYPHWSYCFP